jgi:hypothetical protein
MLTTTQRSGTTSIWKYLLLFVLSLNAVMAEAQNTNTNNANANINSSPAGNTNTNTNASSNSNRPSAATVACPTPEEFATVKVTRAFKSTPTGEEQQPVTQVQLGDDITVEVEGLASLVKKSLCTNPHKNILLFLDGKPIKDATPFPPTDPEKRLLVFPLKRTEASREVWAFILGSPSWSPRKTQVSVGLEGEYAVESAASVDIEVIPHGWFAFWFILLLFLIGGFGALAVKSDVLRDSGPPPPGGERKPYSLSRTQAAWWFFIVLAAYLFIGIITGDFSTSITGTVLVLLGISAGTVLGSAAIDASNAAAPPAGGQPNQPAQTAQTEPTTGHWWLDILNDKYGVSFHRFQVAVWTLVLGIIFGVQVYKVLAMPQFNETLLGLMGISAGTYLGLKINEPK